MNGLIKKLSLLVLPIAALAGLWLGSGSAKAATTYLSYDLINNSVFINSSIMSQSSIQSFLNGKGSYLATHSYKEVCSNNYMDTHYAHCGQTVLASYIIHDAAVAYNLSPRVIMATMQKEESLITAQNPTSSQINFAMGYACPDSGGCGSVSGFFNQVDWGTWQLRLNYARANGDNSWLGTDSYVAYACPSATRYYSTGLYPGRNVTFYDDYGTPYTTIKLANAATASMYCYTPHVYPGSSREYYSGSYWFVYYYDMWWGSTIYSWSADLSASNDQQFYNTQSDCQANANPITLSGATFRTGQQYWVKITATNTGSQTWSSSFVRIGTANPYNHAGIFNDGSWASSGRPANLSTSTVAPNDTGVFNCFSITAKQTVDGSYSEHYQLVADGKAWMQDDSSFTLGMQVNNPYNGLITQLSTYRDSNYSLPVDSSVMTYGQKIYVLLKAKNIGSSTWNNSFTRVATENPNNRSSNFYDSSWASTNRPAVMQESSVAPGQTGTFKFVLSALSTDGLYNESFGLVADGQNNGWMPEPTFTYNIRVVSPPLDRLYPGARLYPGQSLDSKNGNYSLEFQGDGNLVVYGQGHALWSSKTNGKSSKSVVMQGDGNLVIYGASGPPLWSTGTFHNGASTLVMQNDGNLVIYDTSGRPTWSSNTEQAIAYATATNSIHSAQTLNIGDSIRSTNGEYILLLQGDGNLVVYKNGGHALWSSSTNGKPVNRAALQGDGNLVLYGTDGKAYWSSRTAGKGYSVLMVQDYGKLVLYDAYSNPTWSTP